MTIRGSDQKVTMRSSVVPKAAMISNEQKSVVISRGRIENIENQLVKAIQNAKSTAKGTKEAAFAWEVVEELSQAVAHDKVTQAPVKNDYDVNKVIDEYLKKFPETMEQFEHTNAP